MLFSGYEFIWLFFVYSFLGWVAETVIAAFRQKRFVNKGLVSLPFCVLYGAAAVFIMVFGKDLQGIWLYIGSVILITVFKWTAGHLIEKIYHERWWDYSGRRWSVGEYVTLPDSALMGLLAVAVMKWGNTIFVTIFHILPEVFRKILVWTFVILLVLDVAATLLVLKRRKQDVRQWENLERRFRGITASLGQKIFSCIEKRIKKAYPNAQKVESREKSDAVFAYGCCGYKMVWLFMIGSFLGDVTETVFCRITAGVWMSRSSVVWGPFSIVWGLAIVMATILLHKYRKKPDRTLFLAGTLLGGAYEYICSVFTELVFGKVFWDYSHIRFNLGGRINLLYCFFWGIAAVVWIKGIYPGLSGLIEKIPVKIGKYLSWVLIVFMCCNMAVSSLALIRSTQRKNDMPAEHGWQKIMDERFDDERLERIYPNAINTD